MLSVLALILAALILAPLGAQAADLVVWWQKGYYDQEDDAIRETIVAFEQETGKQVELSLYLEGELPGKIEAALEAGQPPDFAFGTTMSTYISEWASNDRLVDLTDALGHFSDLFDPDALAWYMLLNQETQQRALYALPVGRASNHVHVWKSLLQRAGFTLPTFRRNGRRSGPSGAIRCSRPYAGQRDATTSGASASTCRASSTPRKSFASSATRSAQTT
jgi:multiple sugar transport system substrate-binding protein